MDKLCDNCPNVATLFNHNRSGTMRFLRVNGFLDETHSNIIPSHMPRVPCKHVSYEIDFDKLNEVERLISRDIEGAKRMMDEKYSK